MTPVFCCGFECGVLHPTAAQPHWRAVGAGSSIGTTTVRSGLRSLSIDAVAATAQSLSIAVRATGASAVNVARLALRFVTLPDVDCIVLTHNVSVSDWGLFFKVSDGKLYCRVNGVNGATGIAVTTGIWYIIDFRDTLDVTGLVATIEAKVDGTALGTAGPGTTAAVQATWVIGVSGSSPTGSILIDDFLSSTTSGDYPLGAGYILSYIPNADGSHNVAGANDFEKTLTGTDITNSTTDAWQLVDERPLPTTSVDFINGIAPPNSTDYVEIAYEDSVESAAPRSVEGIVVYHDASGAGTNNFSVTLRDSNGGTTANIMAAATRNVGATISYARAHFATIPGGGAWTLIAFNALRSRFLVSDASPDPYIDALMLEAEYADTLFAQACM